MIRDAIPIAMVALALGWLCWMAPSACSTPVQRSDGLVETGSYNGPPTWLEWGPGHVWTPETVHIRVPTTGYHLTSDGVEVVDGTVVARVTLTAPGTGEVVDRGTVDLAVLVGDLELPLLKCGKLAIDVRQIRKGVRYETEPSFLRALATK